MANIGAVKPMTFDPISAGMQLGFGLVALGLVLIQAIVGIALWRSGRAETKVIGNILNAHMIDCHEVTESRRKESEDARRETKEDRRKLHERLDRMAENQARTDGYLQAIKEIAQKPHV